MEADYLIVGLGLAGIAFCETLQKNNKTFVVIDNATHASSAVAGGIYNPVILKRFTLAWNAPKQIEIAASFYSSLEEKLQIKIDYKMPVYRRLASYEEQNLWFEATDRKELAPYLDGKIHPNHNQYIDAPFGFGKVFETGRMDTALLLTAYSAFLSEKGLLQHETFDYNQVITENDILYKNIRAKHLIFSEGFAMKNNPFFNYLPLDGTKGELLTIKAPLLQLDAIINASVYIIPLENDYYRVGATYHWTDKTPQCTQEAAIEILENIKKIIRCPFEVVSQEAGIRPTVKDRKPLVGVHPVYKNLYVLNGLGTRGVMIAPQMAEALYQCIEQIKPLDKEISVKRYEKLFSF